MREASSENSTTLIIQHARIVPPSNSLLRLSPQDDWTQTEREYIKPTVVRILYQHGDVTGSLPPPSPSLTRMDTHEARPRSEPLTAARAPPLATAPVGVHWID